MTDPSAVADLKLCRSREICGAGMSLVGGAVGRREGKLGQGGQDGTLEEEVEQERKRG